MLASVAESGKDRLNQRQVGLLCNFVEKSPLLIARSYFFLFERVLRFSQMYLRLANKIGLNAHRPHPNE